MTKLLPLMPGTGLPLFNNVMDGMKIYDQIKNLDGKLKLRNDANRLVRDLPEIANNCRIAKQIMDAYPDCIAGRTIANVFAVQDMDKIFNFEKTIDEIREWQNNLG